MPVGIISGGLQLIDIALAQTQHRNSVQDEANQPVAQMGRQEQGSIPVKGPRFATMLFSRMTIRVVQFTAQKVIAKINRRLLRIAGE